MITIDQQASVRSPLTPPSGESRRRPVTVDASGRRGHFWSFLGTFGTTLLLFAVFLVQGVIVANVLGPQARGEFGTVLFFPRDLLLYTGLLGGVELITALAANRSAALPKLRAAAIRLAFATGSITAAISFVASAVFLFAVNGLYLLPYVGLVCLFLPLEHAQLIVSGVDRGTNQFVRYNLNRLLFAIVFPIAVLVVFGLGVNHWVPNCDLAWVCSLFVVSRMIGLWPTLRNLKADFSTTAILELPVKSANEAPCPADFASLRVRRMLKNGRGYAWSMFATEFFERLDILLIIAIATMEQSGQYFVAIPAAALVTIVPNSLGVFSFNAGANANFRVSSSTSLAILFAVLAIQAVTAWLLYLVLPILIPLFFGDRFEPAIAFAIWLLPASALKGFLQFADGFLKGRGQAYVGVVARVLSIGVMLVSFAILYGGWNLYAVPAAAAIGQLCSAIIISIAVVRFADRTDDSSDNLMRGVEA